MSREASVRGLVGLFPAFVAQHSVAFEPHAESQLADRFPGIHVPASLARAVPKRRIEYAAGRFCAQQALRACSPEDASSVIGIGSHGEPLWPAGIVGAITHTREFAAAAVALKRDARAIGFDAERLTQLSADVLEYIAVPAEIPALAFTSGMTADAVASVVFSAKEALFKCLYPEVQRYFDFRDALIEALDSNGTFTARLLVGLTPHLPQGSRFEGRFALADGRVYTAIVLEP
ncbi:MAG: 4'-phosphopantetheinyl transferase superfamily protein [Pseudomonadota bacterium]